MKNYTKEFKKAFGYKSIVENIFENKKNIVIYFTDGTQSTFENVDKIDYLENNSFVSIVINYNNHSFETAAENVEKILIMEK